MPYNPDGSFSILNEIGTGYACNNALVPLLGADLDDIATSFPPQSSSVGAWTAYTPSVVATVGTFNTVSATGAYFKFGRMVATKITVTITDAGTATAWYVTLPFESNGTAVFSGVRSINTLSIMGIASSDYAGTQNLSVFNYDGTSSVDTVPFNLAGVYESTT